MASPVDETNAMNAKDATEYVVDQGLYYSPSNYYGYYSTGYESPVEWDDHHRFFCIDGHDLNYTNLQTESLPYVYYAPSYVYPQSPYNPYNPYIPGNFIGLDGSLVGSHQYYSGSTFQHPVSSPASVQVPQSSLVTNSPDIPVLITSSTNATMRDSVGFVHTPSFVSGKATNSISRTEPSRATSGQTYSSRISEGRQASSVPIKLAAPQRSNSSSNVPQIPSSDTSKDSSLGGVSNTRSPPRINVPTANPLPDFVSPINGWTMVDARPRLSVSGSWANGNGRLDTLGEQNRGPRTNRLNIQTMKSIIVKAYTSKAGTVNEDGNIIIHTDHYNREDFPINYVDAKFFVIKSYSEDDIHKSIKYNVWSSTPNGNKRLDAAYEEVHKITGTKCPIFLFFSVNASGQFCGVAEMVGPVDFQKNMDFWQQDKWSGSFPVKWHIIKDVRNANFRHIILENNENKPVTNSRDTQEIPSRQGMEMLAIFKDYACKTSILDDFIYYEDRQKIMQDEKSRFPRFNGPLFFSTSENSSSPNTLTVSSDKTETTAENIPPTNKAHSVNHESKQTELTDNTITQSEGIDIGSLSIHSKEEKSIEEKKVGTVDDSQDNTVTVGSFPLKVAGLTEPPGLLTIGSIPINPNASKPS